MEVFHKSRSGATGSSGCLLKGERRMQCITQVQRTAHLSEANQVAHGALLEVVDKEITSWWFKTFPKYYSIGIHVFPTRGWNKRT